MSKSGKILFVLSVIFFFILCGIRLVLGGFHPMMWVPLALTLLCFILAAVKDHRGILNFLTLRTTKHGMNMGALILLVLAGLFCINLLAVRYEKKWDWSSDKLNSLSDQSVKAAQGLKANTEILLLYREDQAQGENLQKNTRDIVSMFANVSQKISFHAYNAIQRPDLAQKYDLSNGPYAVYAVQGDSKVKIDQPTEEGISRALLKFGREKKKVVYFLIGHGERAFDAKDEDGLSNFKQDLSVTYDVKTLKLYDVQNTVPEDAALVAIVRPMQELLDSEMLGLRTYAKRGGHFFIATDPGFKNGMAQLTKSFGVEFGNDYILDLRSQVIKGGPATVLGTTFERSSEIVRSFQEGSFVIFHVASSLRAAPDLAASLHVTNLIQTDAKTMSVERLKDEVTYQPNGPHTVAVEAHGKMASGDKSYAESGPEFSAVIVGDSDFLSNRLFHNNLNRDFALNSISSLADDKDLVSIRPKEPKGTKLEVTNQSFMLYILCFLIPLPLLMFATGGFVAWRRKAA